MKYIYLLSLLALTACAGDEAIFNGTYSCEDCTYQELNFNPGGDAVLKSHELTIPGTYIKEGDSIAIDVETTVYTFTLQKDGTLRGTGDVEGTYKPKK